MKPKFVWLLFCVLFVVITILMEYLLFGFHELMPYSFSYILIHWFTNFSLLDSGVGFLCKYSSYNSLALNLNMVCGKQPFKDFLTSANHVKSAWWTSMALDLYPLQRALFFVGAQVDGSLSWSISLKHQEASFTALQNLKLSFFASARSV